MEDQIVSFQGEYRFLSNFWPCKVWFDGIEYPSVEHAYVAAKVMDHLVRLQIRGLPTPGQAKRFGRHNITSCKEFRDAPYELRKDWDHIKLHVMRMLLNEKFRDKELYEKLLTTRGKELIEGNAWGDTFWGQSPVGNGHNHLGRLLMEIRDNKSLERFIL